MTRSQLLSYVIDCSDADLDFIVSALRERRRQVDAVSVSDLRLSARSRNALKRIGVSYAEELVRFSRLDLLQLKHIGLVSVREIEDKLMIHGLKLRPDRSANHA